MKIVYGKSLTAEENAAARDISETCGISYDTARLLLYRNIDTPEKAKKFLNPGESGLYDPFGLSGMRAAAERISLAKERKEKILVFGDYDADGVCASSILYRCLKKFGAEAIVTVPEREEGYGLNPQKIAEVKKRDNVTLLITVDCGISDRDKIEEIKKTGIDVIVTDHHEPPDDLPDCIRINPKIKGQSYPFDGLCGAGVAYKLGYALIGKEADEYLDLAALATVADSMDLIDENRNIVFLGLKLMNGAKKRAVFELLGGGTDKKFTSQSLAFGVAPRVNAGGRMGDAATALKAFISDNKSEVFDACVRLNEYNIARQADCDAIYRQAKGQINSQKLYDNSVITVAGDGWKTGFIGIVAAKLVEDYNRPVIVFAKNADGFMKGSARSVEYINIYDAIDSAKKYVLGFGGHSQAAGVSLDYENYKNFSSAVCEFADKAGIFEREKEIFVDMRAEGEMNVDFIKEIDRLEPFGVGNRRPLFSVSVGSVKPRALKNGSPHFSFATKAMEMLDFNGENDVYDLTLPINKTIIFEPNYSVFRNKESVKGFVKYVLPEYGDFSSASLKIFDRELCRLKENVKADYTEIRCADVKIERGFGTVYVVSDEANLKNYDYSAVAAYLFNKKDKTNANCVMVSPESIPDGYEKAVYLDEPTAVFGGVKAFVCREKCGFSKMKNLSVDRSDFEDAFKRLCERENDVYEDAASFFDGEKTGTTAEQAEQFVFAAEVFMELGFFECKDGRLKRDRSIKASLDKSKIYNAVCAIRVNYE